MLRSASIVKHLHKNNQTNQTNRNPHHTSLARSRGIRLSFPPGAQRRLVTHSWRLHLLCSMNVNNTGLMAPFLTTSALKKAHRNDSCFLELEELCATTSPCPAAVVQPHSWSSTPGRTAWTWHRWGAAHVPNLPRAHRSVPAMETPASQHKTGPAS